MPMTLLLLIAVGVNPVVSRFAADHPRSTRILGADGHLAHASGFLADMGSRDPAGAAQAFLSDYAEAFGLIGQSLVLQGAPAPGDVGAVRFSRTINGLPVFDADLVVGVDDHARVFVVNSGPITAAVSGSHVIGETLAYKAAIGSLGGDLHGPGPATVLAGWRPLAGTTRAVYRVDLVAQQPAGDWRTFIDSETGRLLFRENLRSSASAPGTVFEISPVETAAAACPLTGSAHSFCASPVSVTMANLTTGTDLTGTQTSAYNCKGADAPTNPANVPGSCAPITAAAGAFNFPVDSTYVSVTDDFAGAMAYYHLDKHVSFFKKLDPTLPPAGATPNGSSRALRGSLPALVNVFQAGAPFNNAFFSPSLDAMVFGQGATADYAYDATVMYHEFTHGVVFAWGGFSRNIDALGGLIEPAAVNEGTADSMAVSETGRSEVGAFIGARSNPATAALRDMNDPNAARSCRGNAVSGSSLISGVDGEEHDDGEIWNGFYWEVFSGLRTAAIKACNGNCEAGPAIQYKALQLAAGTSPTFASYWQTFKAAAAALLPSSPLPAFYIDCVARRRQFEKCDRTVPVYAGESKVEVVEIRYSPFQIVLSATGATQFAVCGGDTTTTAIYVRQGQPVALSGIDPNTGNATITADGSATFSQACSAGSKVFSLPSAGTWYLLFDTSVFTTKFYRVDASPNGIAARPVPTAPPTCAPPFPLSISVASPSVPPRGQVTVTATGGSGTGYTWAITTNNSGGSIIASSGAYTAGATGGVIDVVQVTDSLGETATRNVTVTAGVSISPSTVSLAPNAHQTFTASGGSGTGFTWALSTNASGGMIDAAGNYKVGPTGSVTDVVNVTDSLGNSATATVTVSAAPKGGCATGGIGNVAAMLLAALVLLGRRRMRRCDVL